MAIIRTLIATLGLTFLLAFSGCDMPVAGTTRAIALDDVSRYVAEPSDGAGESRTDVIVMGMIHARHRDSALYSLDRIRQTVTAINPDLVLTELPADTYQQALDDYRRFGEVRERRARAFPEYTDAIIPMAADGAFEFVGTAAWTPTIAGDRRRVLDAIANDPARADQWSAYREAQNAYRRAANGRGDDPAFIHSAAYDEAVEARYAPYVAHFDAELGAGGWEAINAAHWANIAEQLDAVSGAGQRVLITYGGFHKHQFLRRLAQRDDIRLISARGFFEE